MRSSWAGASSPGCSMATPTVRDIDRGWKRVIREFLQGSKEAVAGYPVGATTGLAPEGTPIWLYMTYNEEGVPALNIPARPFMAQAFQNNSQKYEQMMDRGVVDVISSRGTMANVLTRIAVEMHNDIKRELLSGNFAPNAPSTVERKGSSLPLFDTGAATSAVTFEVRDRSTT